jgi:hypothetical protein
MQWRLGGWFLGAVMVLGMVLALVLLGAEPVRAAYCRVSEGRQVCVVDAERSAKNFWEYRAKVTIDGKPEPVGLYDCRDRFFIDEDGFAEPFSRHPAGPVICGLFKQKRYSGTGIPPAL